MADMKYTKAYTERLSYLVDNMRKWDVETYIDVSMNIMADMLNTIEELEIENGKR